MLLAAALTGAALMLSLAATGDGNLPGDVRLARWLQAHPIPLAEPLTAFTNDYVTGRPLTAAGMAFALALLAARRVDAALLITLATWFRLTNGLLKLTVDSPRPTPDLVTVTERADGLGFPSGHAMGAALLLGAVAYLLARPFSPLAVSVRRPPYPPLPGRRGRLPYPPLPGGEGPGVRVKARSLADTLLHAGALACLALILLTGYGRILVGAHWPSDVLGGYLWGGLLLLLALRITGRVAERIPGAGRPRP